jgi:hypothetical protein
MSEPTREQMRESILDAVMVDAIPSGIADFIIALIENYGPADVQKATHLSTSVEETKAAKSDNDCRSSHTPAEVEEAMATIEHDSYYGGDDTWEKWRDRMKAALATIKSALSDKVSREKPDIASKEREEMLNFIDEIEYDPGYYYEEGKWDMEKMGQIIKSIRALVLSEKPGIRVTREEVREWAKTMSNCADHYEKLTREEFIAVAEGNENYLTDRLNELGVTVEGAKP